MMETRFTGARRRHSSSRRLLLMRSPGSSKSIVIAVVLSSFFTNAHFQSPLLAMNCLLLRRRRFTAGTFGMRKDGNSIA